MFFVYFQNIRNFNFYRGKFLKIPGVTRDSKKIEPNRFSRFDVSQSISLQIISIFANNCSFYNRILQHGEIQGVPTNMGTQ